MFTTLLEDSFTGGAGPLSAHTSDSGHAWTAGPAWGGIASLALNGSGSVARSGSGTSDAKAGALASAATGFVRATIPTPSSPASQEIAVKVAPSFNTGHAATIYFALNFFSGSWKWSLFSEGTSSTFNAFAPSSGEHEFVLEIAEEGLTLTMDGATLGTLPAYGGGSLDMTGYGAVMTIGGSGVSVGYLKFEQDSGPPPAFWQNKVGVTETLE